MAGVTVRDVLAEARGLVGRLHERDRLADGLVSATSGLAEKLAGMREYQEDLAELAASSAQPNKPSPATARQALIHSLQQENRQIRQLEAENRRLQTTLEEYEAGIELIMEKHRQQMGQVKQAAALRQVLESALEKLEPEQSEWSEAGKARDFAALFSRCLAEGEAASHADAEELTRLRTENRTLRHLLLAALPNEPRLLPDFLAQRGGLLEEASGKEGDSTPQASLSPTHESKELPNEPTEQPKDSKDSKEQPKDPAGPAKKPLVNGTSKQQTKKAAPPKVPPPPKPAAPKMNGPLRRAGSGEAALKANKLVPDKSAKAATVS